MELNPLTLISLGEKCLFSKTSFISELVLVLVLVLVLALVLVLLVPVLVPVLEDGLQDDLQDDIPRWLPRIAFGHIIGGLPGYQVHTSFISELVPTKAAITVSAVLKSQRKCSNTHTH